MNVLLTIAKLGSSVATYAPIAIDLAIELKHLIEKNEDYTVTIQEIARATVDVNKETLEIIKDWKEKNGIS